MTEPLMTPRIEKKSSTRRKKYKYRNLLVDIDNKNHLNEGDQKQEEAYTFEQFLQLVNKFEFQKNQQINLRTKKKQDRPQNQGYINQKQDKALGGKLNLMKTLSIQLPRQRIVDQPPKQKFLFLTANRKQIGGSRNSAMKSQIQKNQRSESIFTQQNIKKQKSQGDRSDYQNIKMSVMSNRSSYGRSQINQYQIKKEIGCGGFSKVSQCINIETKQVFAMKQIKSKDLRKKLPMKNNQLVADDLISNQIALLKKLDHPNIVKLYEVIEDKEKNIFYLILQYCSGGYINQYSSSQQQQGQSQGRYKKLFESQCKRLYQQLSLAIDYIHNVAKIAHRDIKPENILIHEGQVKLTDFGLGTQQIFVSSGSGTKGYLPPEARNKNMVSSKKPRTPYTPSLRRQKNLNFDESNISNFVINNNTGKVTAQMGDIWSLGITLIVLLKGKLEFIEDDKLQDFVNNLKDISPDCKDFLNRCLKIDPKERITAKEILDHPWIKAKKTSSYSQIHVSQQQKITAIVQRSKKNKQKINN